MAKKQRIMGAVRKTSKGLVVTPKIDLFAEEFLRNGGNATEAAMKVWNCSNKNSASQVGSQALKKLRGTGRLYLESRGYHYGKLMDTAIEKMKKSKKPDWWDRVMKIAGYEDFMTKKGNGPVSVNVFGLHSQIASDYIEGESGEVIKELPNEE